MELRNFEMQRLLLLHCRNPNFDRELYLMASQTIKLGVRPGVTRDCTPQDAHQDYAVELYVHNSHIERNYFRH